LDTALVIGYTGMLTFIERSPLLEKVSHSGMLPLLFTKLQLRGALVHSQILGLREDWGIDENFPEGEAAWDASMGRVVSFIEIPSMLPSSPRLSFSPSSLEIDRNTGLY